MQVLFSKFFSFVLATGLIIAGYLIPLNAQVILQKDTVQAQKRYPYTQYFTDTYSYNPQQIDTQLYNFHRYIPAVAQPNQWHYLGNIGLAAKPLVFEFTRNIGFNLGFRRYELWQFTLQNQHWFTGPYPYSQWYYSFGAGQEQIAGVTFSQTFKQRLRLNFDYRRLISQGIYKRQKAGWHNLSVSLHFKGKKERYNALFSTLINSAELQHNGGVVFEDLFSDTSFFRKTILNVQLLAANGGLRNRQWRLQQHYDFGNRYDSIPVRGDSLKITRLLPQFRIGHAISYADNFYAYNDPSPQSANPSAGIYPNFYISRTNTADTIKAWQLRNEVFASAMRFKSKQNIPYFTAYAGLAHQFTAVNQANYNDTLPLLPVTVTGVDTVYTLPPDTLFTLRDTSFNLNSIELFAHFSTQTRNQQTYFKARFGFVPIGFNRGDISLQGQAAWFLAKKIGSLYAQAQYQLLTPDATEQRYFSNHYWWKQPNLKQISVLQIGGGFKHPASGSSLSASQYILNNYIIWNGQGHPQQLSGKTISITQLMGNINLHWRKLHFENTIVGQFYPETDTASFEDLPKWISRHNIYIETWLFKKAMLSQFGLDISYNTAIDAANRFSPAIGQFFNANTNNVTNLTYYPVVNVYCNIKISRVRVFALLQHANQGLFGTQNGVLATPAYPLPDRAFKLGLVWQFYD